MMTSTGSERDGIPPKKKIHPGVTKQFVIDIFKDKDTFLFWHSLKDTGLLEDVNFVIQAFEVLEIKDYAQRLWNMLGETVRNDSSVVAAALSRRVLTFSGIPKSFADDKDWCLETIRTGHLFWRILPRNRKRDVEYALAARGHICFSTVARKVRDKERLWMEWACKFPKTVSETNWRDLAPLWIKGDEKIMMDVICLDPLKVKCIDDSLETNTAFIQSLLKANILLVMHLSATTREAVPGLFTIQNIKRFVEAAGNVVNARLSSAVPKHNWLDCEFVLGWIRVGLRLPKVLPETMRENKEIFLEYARSGNLRRQVQLIDTSSQDLPYSLMSDSLKNDKAFVACLLESGGDPDMVMCNVATKLKEDDYLQVMAASKSSRYILFAHDSSARHHSMLQKMERQKREFEGFFLGVLCGSHPGSGSHLTMLTDTNIRRVIASYFDFPIGKHLSHLCKALELRERDGDRTDRRGLAVVSRFQGFIVVQRA